MYPEMLLLAGRYSRPSVRRWVVKSDGELQRDVSAELAWDPSVGANRISVEANDGTVTLAGKVASYARKCHAEAAALRVAGVRELVTHLAVELSATDRRSDEEIAGAARQVLAWNACVPAGRIMVAVDDGWITLSGEVEWAYQGTAAEMALRNLVGIKGLLNLAQVGPGVAPADVGRHMEAALRRCAQDRHGAISVAANGGTVTLSGELDSWQQRHAGRRAACAAPGIRNVVDGMTIGG